MLIVDAQNGRQVGEQVARLQEVADLVAQARRAALAAPDPDFKPGLAGLILHQLQADIMDAQAGAVFGRAIDGDLELARQEGEFRVEGRPLADDLRPGTAILQLVRGGTGERVGGDIADAIARGLDGVHLDRGQLVQNVRNIGQGRPVVLDIGARGEMAIALVILAGDAAEHAQLGTVHRAIGNGDAEHVGVQLQIDAIHQAQRLELVFGQAAINAALHLVAEFGNSFAHHLVVICVVLVHGVRRPCGWRSGFWWSPSSGR